MQAGTFRFRHGVCLCMGDQRQDHTGSVMGDLNSYFFFATAAGLTAAAIAIAILSAIGHFREASVSSQSSAPPLAQSDASSEQG